MKIIGHNKLIKDISRVIDSGYIYKSYLINGQYGHGSLCIAILIAAKILKCKDFYDVFKHPDFYYLFPYESGLLNKEELNNINNKWVQFIKYNPYSNLYDWQYSICENKKDFIISVNIIERLLNKLVLKPFYGNTIVVLIWGVDKMNKQAANKILKPLEDPYRKIIFILITNDKKNIISTVLSRCQIINIPILKISDIEYFLIQKGLDLNKAKKIALLSNYNINNAANFLKKKNLDHEFEIIFCNWIRSCFMIKLDNKYINNIFNIADTIFSMQRYKQLLFLEFCLEIFRIALIHNYNIFNHSIKIEVMNFKWENFTKFITLEVGNFIRKHISEAIFNISRNANTKIIFIDLSFNICNYFNRL